MEIDKVDADGHEVDADGHRVDRDGDGKETGNMVVVKEM